MTTAVAMSAQPGAQLRDEHIANLEELTPTMPSFASANQGPTSAVNIRGMGMSGLRPGVYMLPTERPVGAWKRVSISSSP